jgi:hypothetical protein
VFRRAFEIVGVYTRPVIISRKTVDGKCASSIGAYIIVNDEGWILTAFHIIKMLVDLVTESQTVKDIIARRSVVICDTTMTRKAKNKALGQLPKPKPEATTDVSAWWGADGINLIDPQHGIEGVDLTVTKIGPIPPNWVSDYPVFKDPSKGILPGVSLARLGYPFQPLNPTWDAAQNRFNLALSAPHPPVFLNEGVLSRMIDLQFPNQPPSPFPLCWIETSSPGLKGQSGGPIFDVEGTVWGIQSNTYPYPLGFDPDDPNSKGKKLHQFLNVGRGVHPITIVELLKSQGVKHSLSNY